jgi:hypothetical protein
MRTLSIGMAVFGAVMTVSGLLTMLSLAITQSSITSDQFGGLSFCVTVGMALMGGCGLASEFLRAYRRDESEGKIFSQKVENS